jgi:hypothetical protein
MTHSLTRRFAALTTITLACSLLAGLGACTSHAATPAAAVLAAEAPTLPLSTGTDMAPQPPFDTTPITPVESAGASAGT